LTFIGKSILIFHKERCIKKFNPFHFWCKNYRELSFYFFLLLTSLFFSFLCLTTNGCYKDRESRVTLNFNEHSFSSSDCQYYDREIKNDFVCRGIKNFDFSYINSGPYTYQRQGYPPNPIGYNAKPNGLIHTFFRPSDDLQKLPYLIPSQFFAHHTLKLLLELVKKLEWTNDFSDDIVKLISDLHNILFDDKIKNNQVTTITFNHPKHGLIYLYETDGLGGKNLMDDSNIPSLLSLPYVSPDDIPILDPIYQNTRKFVLSPDNPWYFKGNVIEGKYIH
jgi:hypothetical protein